MPLRRGIARGGAAALKLQDLFNGTVGTLLSAHAFDIGPAAWTIGAAGFQLDGAGNCNQVAGGGTPVAWGDSAATDVNAYGTFSVGTLDGNHATGLIIRVQDSTHFWLAQVDNTTLYLYENNAGFTLRASQAWAGASSGDHVLHLQAVGNLISAWVDSEAAISYTSSLFNTQTKCGLRNFWGGGGSGASPVWRDFQVA